MPPAADLHASYPDEVQHLAARTDTQDVSLGVKLAIAFGTFDFAFLLFLWACLIPTYRRRWRPRLRALVATSVALVTGKQRRTRDALSIRYRLALDAIVAARLKRESSRAHGEPVFLSHYVRNGVFRHWVLHTHSCKFELRRKAPTSRFEWRGSTSLFAAGEYFEANIGTSTFSMDAYKRSIAACHSPEVGRYFYSMVGWTTLSQEEIARHCADIFNSFGNYGLVSNNCQHFLRTLADEEIAALEACIEKEVRKAAGKSSYVLVIGDAGSGGGGDAGDSGGHGGDGGGGGGGC
ncbi:hypothetical protein NLG97_g2167 [Lecanicillium saksenae]|uniref:Uncharacterized protein n=1 Tax=Lecanicillium saksenae TaxID=468837 RepID=A0ACC1R5R0_9HYPO|nr:hypothetical protein NLG97_g2167 [Lecanicillium saksenae]